MNIRILYIFRN